MGGPFRELFAELPRALFDTLKGVGEEAVKMARRPIMPHRPSVTSTLGIEPIIGYLCERFEWKSATIYHSAIDRSTVFAGRRACGHKFEFSMSDGSIEDAHPSRIIDTIDRVWSRAKRIRPCYCVQRGPE